MKNDFILAQIIPYDLNGSAFEPFENFIEKSHSPYSRWEWGKNPATLLKIKQASRRLERLACFGDDGDGSDDVYRIWVGVCKKDRHHRHHRHAYSEMTLAVYYCSKQK